MSMIVDLPVTLLGKAGIKNEKNAKLIVYGTLLVVGGIALFIIGKKIKNLIGGPTFNAVTMNDQLSNLDINMSNVTISQADATIISNNLLVAMNWFGTDDQAIIDNLSRLQTKEDLVLIIKTFGIKLYDGFGLGEDWLSRKISTPKDLNGWIRAELSGSNLQKVKDIYNNLGVAF
jgi:hypothetical protein